MGGLFISEPKGDVEDLMLEYVRENAKKGDPDSVLKAIDKFYWDEKWLMLYCSEEKGKFIDDAVRNTKPMKALELGAYSGFYSVRLARLLTTPGSKLYSIEANPKWQGVAKQLTKFANVSNTVNHWLGPLNQQIGRLKKEVGTLDLVFIDHGRDNHFSDLKLLEENALLKKGTQVIAENILFPGCKDYRLYVMHDPKYSTEEFYCLK
jgi:catechol O-methyltransferase